jgi:Fis family transcriptional regulator, factor for inversion stimulation protein
MSRGEAKHGEIADCVRNNLSRYFEDLDGAKPGPVYDMVLSAVEKPMLEVVLQHAGGNQTLAADMLGLNRNTLRKKMLAHRIK